MKSPPPSPVPGLPPFHFCFVATVNAGGTGHHTIGLGCPDKRKEFGSERNVNVAHACAHTQGFSHSVRSLGPLASMARQPHTARLEQMGRGRHPLLEASSSQRGGAPQPAAAASRPPLHRVWQPVSAQVYKTSCRGVYQQGLCSSDRKPSPGGDEAQYSGSRDERERGRLGSGNYWMG